MTATFAYEDSDNCGGPNSATQGGTCGCTITFETAVHVDYSITGNVETYNSGYDYFTIYRDGGMKAQISSFNNLVECGMTSNSDSSGEDLPAGTYSFTFVADTGDGMHHVGMSHTGTITWS